MMTYEKTHEIEAAVSKYFNRESLVVVPNISWGLFPYELDLCVLSKNLYASEIEIKISVSDLKAEKKKNHQHDRNRNYIKYLWFAMPDKMMGNENLIPERAGILYVDHAGRVNVFRQPQPNKDAKKWEMEMAYKLARLGTIRMWSYKEALLRYRTERDIIGGD